MKDKKTEYIQVRISPENKKKLKEKANSLDLDVSKFIERIAEEPIIFVSKGVRVILESVK